MTAAPVLIVGGGPAGSSTAIALAMAGIPVTLIDRARFPRRHIGESLPPQIDALLGALGVAEAVARAGFVRMTGTTIVQDFEHVTHDFDPAQREQGYQVERERFDALLLDRARALGAVVREETALVEVVGDAGGVRGAKLRGPDGAVEVVEAAMVVDASGSAGVVSRALGLKRRDAIRTVALAGYWSGSGVPHAVPASNTLFETHPAGWMWSVRRADGLRNVTIGLDPSELRGPSEGAAPTRHDPTTFYLERVRRSALLQPILAPAALASEITAHDATWFHAERVIGPGWILVGDAASFIDPLTSQGVYKAVHSGIAAAAVLRTILTRPADAELARAYYQGSQDELHHNYVEVALSFYRGSPFADAPFWQARTRDDRPPRRLGHADTVPDGLRQERRARFIAEVGAQGGRGLHLTRDARLVCVETPVVDRGLVVRRAQLGVDGLALPVPPGAQQVSAEVLWSVLDGRPLEAVFEGYTAQTGAARSSDLGRALMAALTQLAELGLIHATPA